MRKHKKITVALLTMAMAFSSILPANVKPAKAEKLGIPIDIPSADSEDIYVYSWNDELGKKLAVFDEMYPELAGKVHFVNLGLESNSSEYIDTVNELIDKNGSDVPSIVAFEDALADNFGDSRFVNLEDVGITDDCYKNAYASQKRRGSFGGKLKAVSWQSVPGFFIYKTDIAQKVLGTSDPAVVQSYLSTPSKFLSTAEAMKKAGYNMTTGIGVINDGAINADDEAGAKELANALLSKGYDTGTPAWSEKWYEDMNSPEVFGIFGCPWFLYQFYKSDYKSNICEGPIGYTWGGTYLGITKNCKNNELAALVLYTLSCDEEAMLKLALQDDGYIDFVNNTSVISDIVDSEGGTTDVLNGQNPLPVWNSSASRIEYNGLTFLRDKDNNVICYDEAGNLLINQFACDGEFTYYFQADGTAMRNRLTYHPDGIHVIYFDTNGHEVFSDFANVKKSIAGDPVDDYCFFDVYGYMYVDVVTYDKTGKYIYYINEYGVMEINKWFQFSNTVKCADGNEWPGAAGNYGFAQEDGSLLTNTYTYDWLGRLCYLQGTGVALYQ